jgi:transposase
MEKIPKQEYTTEFKERAVKHVKEGKSIGLSAKELGLVEQTLRNWVKLSAAGKLTGVGAGACQDSCRLFHAASG